MRAKGLVRITESLLKKTLGIPDNVSLDKVYVDESRGIVNLVISTDAPSYVCVPEIKPITFNVSEGAEIRSVDITATELLHARKENQ